MKLLRLRREQESPHQADQPNYHLELALKVLAFLATPLILALGFKKMQKEIADRLP